MSQEYQETIVREKVVRIIFLQHIEKYSLIDVTIFMKIRSLKINFFVVNISFIKDKVYLSLGKKGQ